MVLVSRHVHGGTPKKEKTLTRFGCFQLTFSIKIRKVVEKNDNCNAVGENDNCKGKTVELP